MPGLWIRYQDYGLYDDFWFISENGNGRYSENSEIKNNITLTEKIKKYRIINENCSIENGLWTHTMKVKSNKVIAKYKNILENFYNN